jgi:steroid 5-alpha reductase family enzyme
MDPVANTWWLTPLFCTLAVWLFLTFIFIMGKSKNRYDIIDVAWGLTFILIAGVSYLSQRDIVLLSIQTIVTVLVIVWGLRLSLHIYSRWSHSAHEDPRYVAMRHQYARLPGGEAVNIYVRVFLVQSLLALLISASILVVNTSSILLAPNLITLVGVSVWLLGYYFEAVGDWQLRKHLADPKNRGKIMTKGLWKYTRHPNYFGEATQWWGIWIIALSVPFGWASITGPLIITALLLFITGVPLTEKRFEGREGWASYKKRTSVFLPLPPKK